MKKIPSLLALILVVVLHTACSQSPTPLSSEPSSVKTRTPSSRTTVALTQEPHTLSPSSTVVPPTPTSSLDVQVEDLNGVRIEFWHPWAMDGEDQALAFANHFNTENEYGITVNVFSHGRDLFQDVREAFRAGEAPDLTLGYNNQLLAWNSQRDHLVDLSTYVRDSIWGLSEAEQDDFYSAFWEQDVLEGKRLGLPYYRSSQVIFYNRSWARELGFEAPPSTPEEFEEQACAASEEAGDGRGGWILSNETTTILSWIFAFGGEVTNPQADGYNFDTSQVEEALVFLRGLLEEGCAWASEERYPNAEFASRQALFYTSSIAGVPFQVEAFEEAGEDDEWTSIPFPSVEGQPVITVYGLSLAIPRSSPEEQLAAWLFARWLTQPENQAEWVELTSYFPTRASTLDHIDDYVRQYPQWEAAVELIPYSRYEPAVSSWGVVRWVLGDAAGQLFRPDFRRGLIFNLVEDLDETAQEIHAQTE